MTTPSAFIVRLLTAGGAPAGIGVLVAGRHILTCAHVVNGALGRPLTTADRPDQTVRVNFPLAGDGTPLDATVVCWVPPPAEGRAGDDIAGLELAAGQQPPDGVVAAPLATEPPRQGRAVRVYGCPPERPKGQWVAATIRERVSDGRFQVDSDREPRIRPGFSGSAVFDERIGRIFGIISEAALPGSRSLDSNAIGADLLRASWPAVLDPRRRRGAAVARSELTIVELPPMRFGTEPDDGVSRLAADLDRLADDRGIRPDLLVASGGLTEHGREQELAAAFGFLGGLAEAAELPRSRVLVVPGRTDVNRTMCRHYFDELEERGLSPGVPFFPAWFAHALSDFYDDADLFTPDEPWTLFEVPELSVVVAGLNVSVADATVDPNGQAWSRQTRWFGAELGTYRARGWLRLATAFPGVANRANLVLAEAAAPDTYRLLTVRRTRVTTYARRYDSGSQRWIGDTRLDPDGADWIGHTPTIMTDVGNALADADDAVSEARDDQRRQQNARDAVRPPTFFDRVVAAAQAHWPDATVTERPDDDYFRVSRPLPEGGAEQFPIGVINGAAGRTAVDRFVRNVHDGFAAVYRQVPSELVYSGDHAPGQLVAYTRGHGVRLRSFTEFQGLLDLRPLGDRQNQQLATDPVYPERLYIEQRFRRAHRDTVDDDVRTGLVSEAVQWLAEDGPRLVLVLGDFGRGKTAFLKQLARTLPAELPAVQPILVELRQLVTEQTLDQLLARYLVPYVNDLSMAKLGYMIHEGRIALLLDGFDELEVKVGYDHAADYLRTLLGSVTKQTKLVITSRTQYFMSTGQVATAFGEQLSALTTSRVAILEDFTEEQITEFLTGLYDGDAERARARLELLGSTANLLELTRNPRMLTFVAAMEDDDLRELTGTVSGAALYRKIVTSWLAYESEHRSRALSQAQRFAACRALALRMWISAQDSISLDELTAEVSSVLAELTERGFSTAQMAHAIGSGSLLVRGDGETFRFVHRSIMEWFVAEAAAEQLGEAGTTGVFLTRRVSRQMAGFFTELAGSRPAGRWAVGVAVDQHATAPARQNAALVTELLGPGDGALIMAGVDLRGSLLTRMDFSGAILRGADFRGRRLIDVNLASADLTDADLSGVRMIGGSLRGATLTGSRWDHAALLGTDVLDDPALTSAPELAAAAIAGRDSADVMIRPPLWPRCLAYSPDGTLLAVGSGGIAEIIDVTDGTVLRILQGHRGSVNAVAFSPDGTRIATASNDRTARIWDTATGTTLTTLTGHDSTVNAVAYSPDGTRIATASSDSTARIWDTATGTTLTTLTGHDSTVNAVAYSPDGTRIATASNDRTARIWDTATGTALTTLTGHDNLVYAVAYSPDGTRIATASNDRTARIWDTATGTALTTLTGHDSYVNAVAYSPDGTRIATASDDRTARIWDTATGTALTTLTGHDNPVNAVAYSPDGTRIATASNDRTARIWDTATGTALTTLTGHDNPVNAVAYSPDGTRIATASNDRTARIWDTATGTALTTLTGHDSTVNAVAYSPDGTRIATASNDRTARIWDTATGTALTTLTGHDNPVNAVAYSPDGTRIATASYDRTARIWDTATGTALTTLTGHDSTVNAVAYSPDGTRIATASDDRTARIWDTATGTALTTLTGHDNLVNAVAYSPDGTRIATASYDSTARIWDTATGTALTTLTGHDNPLYAVAYSPDGTRIATASYDSTARIWDTATGTALTTLTGHDNPLYAVAYSPDGTRIATASYDSTARIWDATSGELLATLIALPDNGYATLYPDGSYKLSGDPRDRLWWAIKLCRFAPGELDPYVQNIIRR